MTKENLDVVELFAGVGGFRLGLEKNGWNTIYANQWEPGKKTQWAFDCYNEHFPNSINTNQDISTINAVDIPNHALLVGGFPCQDYSVASTLINSKGIEGKKGVLWWEIRRIVQEKKPRFILLENVDRLLKSPANQRGRDFGIILSCLNNLGYSVEWKIINAGEYGFPQRRRRTFIFATNDRRIQQKLYRGTPIEILTKSGFFAPSFPSEVSNGFDTKTIDITDDLIKLSNDFSFGFENSGYCINFNAYTLRTESNYNGKQATLGDILECNPSSKYNIKDNDLEKWAYLKGAKKELRKSKNGHEYFYSEGPIAYPDYLNKPSRTMLTSESSKNRTTHVIEDPISKKLRLLTPIECERLNGFPDNWTNTGMPEKFRYFCMGNALVVGIIERLGKRIIEISK